MNWTVEAWWYDMLKCILCWVMKINWNKLEEFCAAADKEVEQCVQKCELSLRRRDRKLSRYQTAIKSKSRWK